MNFADILKNGFNIKTESELTIGQNTVLMIVLMFALIFASFFTIKSLAK